MGDGIRFVLPNQPFLVLNPQTLMVLSPEPDTILDPSLLKPTEQMIPLWAFSLLVMSSRVSVQSRRLLLIGW